MPIYKRVWFWVAVVAVLLILFVLGPMVTAGPEPAPVEPQTNTAPHHIGGSTACVTTNKGCK